jgi:hypothetical protein
MHRTFDRAAAAVAMLTLAMAALPAIAAEPIVLAPSAEWVTTGDNESCWISRRFGGDDGVAFSLHAFSPLYPSYIVIVRGDPLPHRTSGSLDFEYRFNPDSEAIATSGILNSGAGVPRVSFGTSLEPASVVEARRNGETLPLSAGAAREAAIDELVLAFSRGRPVSLQLGSLAGPMQQLRECTAQLPAKWGLDTAVEQTLSRRPVPIDIAKWLGPGSYPWEYLRNSLSVRIQLRMMTDANGAVTQCVVQSPSGTSVAGTLACREIVKTARFEPALDARGNPVPSYFSTAIVYYTRRQNGPGHGASRTQGL